MLHNLAARKSLPVVVASGALVLSVALGIRQTFGLFIGPIAGDHLVTVGFLAARVSRVYVACSVAGPKPKRP